MFASGRSMMWPWRHVTGWVLVTAGFSAMVYSRERACSPQVFEPVEVRVAGLFGEELSAISAFRSTPPAALGDRGRAWR